MLAMYENPYTASLETKILSSTPIELVTMLYQAAIESVQAAPASPSGAEPRFPKPMEEYHDEQIPGITAKLVQRIQAEPFNLVGTLIFLGAIIHHSLLLNSC